MHLIIHRLHGTGNERKCVPWVLIRYGNFDFSLTVKAAPRESGPRVKAENEAWFYSKVTVSSCAIISV